MPCEFSEGESAGATCRGTGAACRGTGDGDDWNELRDPDWAKQTGPTKAIAKTNVATVLIDRVNIFLGSKSQGGLRRESAENLMPRWALSIVIDPNDLQPEHKLPHAEMNSYGGDSVDTH